MNFNYCSKLTVRVLTPLQWKELALKCVPNVLQCSQAFKEEGCALLEPGECSSVLAAPRPLQPLAGCTAAISGHVTWAATCKPRTRGADCAWEPNRQCSISPATSASSSGEVKQCWLADAGGFNLDG